MKFTDILPLEKWLEFEKDLYERSGLNISVYDSEGSLVSGYEEWANKLCPVIKNDEKGKGGICVNANNNISLMSKKTKRPVTEECDAGLLKFTVPVFIGDEYLGVVTGCGLLLEDGEVDTFLINKMTGLDEDELGNLSGDIEVLTEEKIDSLINYIQDELGRLIPGYIRA